MKRRRTTGWKATPEQTRRLLGINRRIRADGVGSTKRQADKDNTRMIRATDEATTRVTICIGRTDGEDHVRLYTNGLAELGGEDADRECKFWDVPDALDAIRKYVDAVVKNARDDAGRDEDGFFKRHIVVSTYKL